MQIKSRKGFTLIELLVVIAIIAILAAILFPVFANAKKTAQAASCTSNLNQMGKALLMYIDDSGAIPPASTGHPWGSLDWPQWTECLYKYHKKTEIYQCPARDVNFAYALNENLEGAAGAPKKPSVCIALYEVPGSGNKKKFPIRANQNNRYLDGQDIGWASGNADQSSGNLIRDPSDPSRIIPRYSSAQRDWDVYGGADKLNPQANFHARAWIPKSPQEGLQDPPPSANRHYWLFFPGPHNGANMICFYDGHVGSFKDWGNNMTFYPKVGGSLPRL